MQFIMSKKGICLSGALLLASAQGCQGEEAPAPVATTTESQPRSNREELINCGASLVPAMTGATVPSGSVTRSGVYSASYEAWQAFDASETSMWISQEGQVPAWLGYEWADGPKRVTHYAIKYANGTILSRAPRSWTLEGWNGSAWTVVDTRGNEVSWGGSERREYAVASPGSFSRYRLNITDDNDASAGIVVVSMGRLELYNCGCTPTNQVPAMTGATLPSGTVTRSGAFGTSYEAWQAFDTNDTSASMWISQQGQTPAWVAYEWPNGQRNILRYAIQFANGSLVDRAPRSWTLEGWNGSAWVVLDTRTNEINWGGSERREYAVASPGNFSKYRLNITDDNRSTAGIDVISMSRLELLGCPSTGDTQAPAAPVLTGFSPASPSSNLQPTLSGTAEAGSTVRLFSGNACAGTALATVTVSSTGAFSSVRTVTANTTSVFTATAVDAAGNVSACSAALSYQHDGAAPAAPVLTGFSPASPSNNLQPTLNGTAEAGSTVRLFSGTACAGTALATVTASATGTFSSVRPVTGNATTTFTATTTDAAGNVSACSAALSYRHDSLAPTAPVLTGFSPASPSNSTQPTLSGTAEAGATVRLFSGTACTGTMLTTVVA